MKDQRHQIPPPDGDIKVNRKGNVIFHVVQCCKLCCDIGNHFSPDMTCVVLSVGNHKFTAIESGDGHYNTSDPKAICTPDDTKQKHKKHKAASAHSVQINP